MEHRERWESFIEKHAAVQAVVDEWKRKPTPQARAAMVAAFREYVERLPSMVGQAEASKFEASLRLQQETTDRMAQFHATLTAKFAVSDVVDDADIAFFVQLAEKASEAIKAYAAARDTLHAALERTMAHDDEPDEKGGA